MSFAFEITEDDVLTVLLQNGVSASNAKSNVCEAFDDLDMDEVEAAALSAGHDLDRQTSAAYEEIRNQLASSGWIRAEADKADIFIVTQATRIPLEIEGASNDAPAISPGM